MSRAANSVDSASDRRATPRIRVLIDVEVDPHCDGTYLFALGTAINADGIFIRTGLPEAPGTAVRLRIVDGDRSLALEAEVAWWNPPSPTAIDPGMGVRFVAVSAHERQHLLELVGRVACLVPDHHAAADNG